MSDHRSRQRCGRRTSISRHKSFCLTGPATSGIHVKMIQESRFMVATCQVDHELLSVLNEAVGLAHLHGRSLMANIYPYGRQCVACSARGRHHGSPTRFTATSTCHSISWRLHSTMHGTSRSLALVIQYSAGVVRLGAEGEILTSACITARSNIRRKIDETIAAMPQLSRARSAKGPKRCSDHTHI